MDSVLLSGTITDSNGLFSVGNLAYGGYFLKTDYLGYDPVTSSPLELDGNQPKAALEPIRLSENAQQLGEATVSVERNALETRIDRKIFHADKSLVNKGDNTQTMELATLCQVSW